MANVTIQDIQGMAREGSFEDSDAVLRWFELLSAEGKRMVALAMDVSYDRGYEDGQDD